MFYMKSNFGGSRTLTFLPGSPVVPASTRVGPYEDTLLNNPALQKALRNGEISIFPVEETKSKPKPKDLPDNTPKPKDGADSGTKTSVSTSGEGKQVTVPEKKEEENTPEEPNEDKQDSKQGPVTKKTSKKRKQK